LTLCVHEQPPPPPPSAPVSWCGALWTPAPRRRSSGSPVVPTPESSETVQFDWPYQPVPGIRTSPPRAALAAPTMGDKRASDTDQSHHGAKRAAPRGVTSFVWGCSENETKNVIAAAATGAPYPARVHARGPCLHAAPHARARHVTVPPALPGSLAAAARTRACPRARAGAHCCATAVCQGAR
jgi:hypothetical protein